MTGIYGDSGWCIPERIRQCLWSCWATSTAFEGWKGSSGVQSVLNLERHRQTPSERGFIRKALSEWPLRFSLSKTTGWNLQEVGLADQGGCTRQDWNM